MREPDLSVFKPEEVAFVSAVIENIWELTETEVVDLSRQFVGWRAAALKEEIPYGMVLVDNPRPLSAEEDKWALRVIGEYCERKEAHGRPTGM